jgi:hypothetical protein
MMEGHELIFLYGEIAGLFSFDNQIVQYVEQMRVGSQSNSLWIETRFLLGSRIIK